MAKKLTADIVPSNKMEAEYSPWFQIFMRIESIMDNINYLSAQVKLRDPKFIGPLFVAIELLYEQLIPLLGKEERGPLEKRITELSGRIRGWERSKEMTGYMTFPYKLVGEMEALKKELYIKKQFSGLGIPATSKMGDKDKLKNILGV